MNTIYIIIEENGDDGFELPYNEQFYLTEEEAKKDCDSLNKDRGNRRDYFDVHELTLKK